MRWEQPDDRHGRTAVFLLVAAILVVAALAIALVAGAASQSSQPSGDVVVRGARVPDGTSTKSDASSTRAGAAGPASAEPSPPTVGVASATTVSVPTIELEAALHEGVATNVLDMGPGHWPGTAPPGAYGNLVIAGHRSTSAATFERIGELTPGDPILVGDRTGSYTYLVEMSEVVLDDALDVVTQTPGHTLTLVAPHPPGSEGYRYVVHARLVSTPRAPGT